MASRWEVVSARALQAQVAIRPIRFDDSIEELTALLHGAYARLARMGLNFTAAHQTVETTRRRVEHARCLVAVEDEKLVGTILVNCATPNPLGDLFGRPMAGSIHQLAVAPECAGRGIGSRLLASAESCVRRLGLGEVALDTAESAPQLLAFFMRRGYRSVSPVQWSGKTYRSVIMSKVLARNG